MPRPEQPLPPDGGPVAEFAEGLRRLRRQAGGLPYRELGRRAHFSATTLAEAAAGRRFPSLAVASAFVRACDGNVAQWQARWREVAAALVTESGTAEHDRDGEAPACPYVGLAVYGTDDADRFFGREQLTEDLLARVREHRFVAVFGASGAGKSSLLRAGLHARVNRDGSDLPDAAGGAASRRWRCVAFTPGAHPMQECAAQLAAAGVGPAAGLIRELRADPQALHLSILQLLAVADPSAEVLLIIDQFEEVFTLCADPAERAAFISALSQAVRAANSRTRVVLGLRADFYAHCAQHPQLVDLLRDSQLLVGPMTAEELRNAITRPAATVDCALEAALQTRVIADATGQTNVLPLVSHAMRETWYRRRGRMLTLAAYEACGGITHALAHTAETVYTGLDQAQQCQARALLLSLIRLGEGTGDSRQPLARRAVEPETEPVLQALVEAHLVTVDADGVELTHEALLRAWPRLHGWIDDDRAALLTRQRLTDAAALWEREGRDHGALYRGGRLAVATEWAERHPDDVRSHPGLHRFLTASTRREARLGRRRNVLIATLTVLALLASGLAVVADRAARQARRQTEIAEQNAEQTRAQHAVALSRQLAAQSVASIPVDPVLAARLAVAASSVARTDQADAAMTSVLTTTRGQGALLAAGRVVLAIAFGPDSRTVAAVGDDGTVDLWDARTGRARRPSARVGGLPSKATAAALSADGGTVALATADGAVRVWDAATHYTQGRTIDVGVSGEDAVRALAITGDGRTLAVRTADGARLFDLATGRESLRLAVEDVTDALNVHATGLAFSQDGKTVAVEGDHGTVRRFDTATGRSLDRLVPGNVMMEGIGSMAFSPDGGTLALADCEAVCVWNLATGHTETRPLQNADRQAISAESVALAPDGATMAVGTGYGAVYLLDAATGEPLGGPIRYAADDGVTSLGTAFAADGDTLAIGSGDGTVRLFDAATGQARGRAFQDVSSSGEDISALAFSPDGRTLAVGAQDGTVRLCDTAGHARRTLTAHAAVGPDTGVTSLAFSPDGATLAVGALDENVRLFDPDTGLPQGLPLPDTTGTSRLAFSPDGRTLAVGDEDGTVRLWDPATGRDRVPAIHDGKPGDLGVLSLAFSPDSAILAVGGGDGTIRLWDSASGQARGGAMQDDIPSRSTDAIGVIWVAFSPDGRTLLAGAGDGTVRQWDPAAGHAIGTLVRLARTKADSLLMAVGLSPDGETLTVVSGDGTMDLWPVPLLRDAYTTLCWEVGSLSPQDWAAYAPGEPGPPGCLADGTGRG